MNTMEDVVDTTDGKKHGYVAFFWAHFGTERWKSGCVWKGVLKHTMELGNHRIPMGCICNEIFLCGTLLGILPSYSIRTHDD